jgi:uncharacterized Rmd1/YagE family protein
VYALALGERIDTRGLKGERFAGGSVIAAAGAGGFVATFRYGCVVFFDVDETERAALLQEIRPRVAEPFAVPEPESVELVVDASKSAASGDSETVLKDKSFERLTIVATVMAKSAMLAHYEASVSGVFDQVEPLAIELDHSGRVSRDGLGLVRHIGAALLVQHRMVGRIEVGEKPDLLWDHPELERLHARLVDEYELKDRQVLLERKLDLVSRTAELLLNLLNDRRSLRVEWYIVVLIVAELLILLYQIFVLGH